MNIQNPKILKKITLKPGVEMEVQIDERLASIIKEEYGIEEVSDEYIQIFFRDVLHDAAVKEQ